ncbi:hypothetical protein QAD02_009092 [Eretmocerus hayati]|uniref:Uncharacterized protein n=1 Tax=Eretmocerus hayati TaxID=131215 RepID=A0ACC2NAS0_9HYME|nr:hypothetical protein QAD02_009092 [Eretmocerus hayati]
MSSDNENLPKPSKRRRPIISESEESDDSAINTNHRRRRVGRVLSEAESSDEDGDVLLRPGQKKQNFKLDSEDESSYASSSSNDGVRSNFDRGSTSSEWQSDWESTDELDTTAGSSCKKRSKKSPLKDSRENGSSCESDRSDGESEKCPICLLKFHKQEVANPASCEHCFCLDCLTEWSRNVNTCPIDRQTFEVINVRAKLGGKITRYIPVEPKTQAEAVPQEDPTYCEVCQRCDREDRMLLCDGCDSGYHLECLNPPLHEVPLEEHWYCPECAQNSQNDAEDVEMDLEELPDILEEARRLGLSYGRSHRPRHDSFAEDSDVPIATRRRAAAVATLSSRRSNPLLPRTRQAERVRAMVRAGRSRREAENIAQPSTSSGIDSVSSRSRSPMPGPSRLASGASSSRAPRRSAATTAPRKKRAMRIKRKTKRRTKSKRAASKRAEQQIRQVVISQVNENGELEEIVEYVRSLPGGPEPRRKKKRKKYKKKTTARARTVASVAASRASAKRRLASSLMKSMRVSADSDGLMQIVPENGPPHPSSALRLARQAAGLTPLSLFGGGLGLDYSPPGSDDEYEDSAASGGGGGGTGVLSRPRLPAMSATRRRLALKGGLIEPPSTTPIGSVDLLSSILNRQEIWHSKKSKVTLKSDGSFKVDNPKKSIECNNNNVSPIKLDPKDSKPLSDKKPLNLNKIDSNKLTKQAPMYNNPRGGNRGAGGAGGGYRGGGNYRDGGNRHSYGGGGRHSFGGSTGPNDPQDYSRAGFQNRNNEQNRNQPPSLLDLQNRNRFPPLRDQRQPPFDNRDRPPLDRDGNRPRQDRDSRGPQQDWDRPQLDRDINRTRQDRDSRVPQQDWDMRPRQDRDSRGPQQDWDMRPRQDRDGNRQDYDRPPIDRDGDRPQQDWNRPRLDRDGNRPQQDFDRPPMDRDGNRPWQDRDRTERDSFPQDQFARPRAPGGTSYPGVPPPAPPLALRNAAITSQQPRQSENWRPDADDDNFNMYDDLDLRKPDQRSSSGQYGQDGGDSPRSLVPPPDLPSGLIDFDESERGNDSDREDLVIDDNPKEDQQRGGATQADKYDPFAADSDSDDSQHGGHQVSKPKDNDAMRKPQHQQPEKSPDPPSLAPPPGLGDFPGLKNDENESILGDGASIAGDNASIAGDNASIAGDEFAMPSRMIRSKGTGHTPRPLEPPPMFAFPGMNLDSDAASEDGGDNANDRRRQVRSSQKKKKKQQPIVSRIRLTAYDDDDDDDSDTDCPNFSIYSSETMDVARHTEQQLSSQIAPLQPPPMPPFDDDNMSTVSESFKTMDPNPLEPPPMPPSMFEDDLRSKAGSPGADSIAPLEPPPMPPMDSLDTASTVDPLEPPPMPPMDSLDTGSMVDPNELPPMQSLNKNSIMPPPLQPPPMPPIDSLDTGSTVDPLEPPPMPPMDSLDTASTVDPLEPPPMPPLDSLDTASTVDPLEPPPIPPMDSLDTASTVDPLEPPPMPPMDSLDTASTVDPLEPPPMPPLESMDSASTVDPLEPPPVPPIEGLDEPSSSLEPPPMPPMEVMEAEETPAVQPPPPMAPPVPQPMMPMPMAPPMMTMAPQMMPPMMAMPPMMPPMMTPMPMVTPMPPPVSVPMPPIEPPPVLPALPLEADPSAPMEPPPMPPMDDLNLDDEEEDGEPGTLKPPPMPPKPTEYLDAVQKERQALNKAATAAAKIPLDKAGKIAFKMKNLSRLKKSKHSDKSRRDEKYSKSSKSSKSKNKHKSSKDSKPRSGWDIKPVGMSSEDSDGESADDARPDSPASVSSLDGTHDKSQKKDVSSKKAVNIDLDELQQTLDKKLVELEDLSKMHPDDMEVISAVGGESEHDKSGEIVNLDSDDDENQHRHKDKEHNADELLDEEELIKSITDQAQDDHRVIDEVGEVDARSGDNVSVKSMDFGSPEHHEEPLETDPDLGLERPTEEELLQVQQLPTKDAVLEEDIPMPEAPAPAIVPAATEDADDTESVVATGERNKLDEIIDLDSAEFDEKPVSFEGNLDDDGFMIESAAEARKALSRMGSTPGTPRMPTPRMLTPRARSLSRKRTPVTGAARRSLSSRREVLSEWEMEGGTTPCRDERVVSGKGMDVRISLSNRASRTSLLQDSGLEPITPARPNDGLDAGIKTPAGYHGLGTEAISETDEAMNFEDELALLKMRSRGNAPDDDDDDDEASRQALLADDTAAAESTNEQIVHSGSGRMSRKAAHTAALLKAKELLLLQQEQEEAAEAVAALAAVAAKRKRKKDKRDKSTKDAERNKENIANLENELWKKAAASVAKERQYREKRSKSKESKAAKKKKEKEALAAALLAKKKEKRKELPRYDVRKIVSEKPRSRKDEYGRDLRSSSRSRNRRSRSYRSLSPVVRRRSPSPRSSRRDKGRSRRSLSRGRGRSRTRSRSPHRRSLSPRSKHRSRRSLSPQEKKAAHKSRSKSRAARKRSRSKSKKREKRHHSKRRASRSRTRSAERRAAWEQAQLYQQQLQLRQLAEGGGGQQVAWARHPDWSPSWSRSRSRTPPHLLRQDGRIWSPTSMALLNSVNVSPKNLKVILTNKEAIKKRKKKEKARKAKEAAAAAAAAEKKQRKGKKGKSPPPSKEVFASGDNILVSVCFNKDTDQSNGNAAAELPETIPLLPQLKRRRHEVEVQQAAAAKKAKKSKDPRRSKSPAAALVAKLTKKKEKKKSKAAEIAATKKPTAIIDLDQSPFREQTPSPRDIIVLSDDEEAAANAAAQAQQQQQSQQQQQQQTEQQMEEEDAMAEQMSPESHTPARPEMFSQGPKTPPEPQVKFSISNKQNNLRQTLSNPLMDEDDDEEDDELGNGQQQSQQQGQGDEEDEEAVEGQRRRLNANDTAEMQELMDEQEEDELELRAQEELESRVKVGPNTPPEPPSSPPDSPDAYDPFDPTKSRSPTPEPDDQQQQNNKSAESGDSPAEVQNLDESGSQLDDSVSDTQPKTTSDKPKIISMVTIKRPSPKSNTPPLVDADGKKDEQQPPTTRIQTTLATMVQQQQQKIVFPAINPVLATVAAAVQRSTLFNAQPKNLIQQQQSRPTLPNIFANSMPKPPMRTLPLSKYNKNISMMGQNGSDANIELTNDNIDMSSPYSPGSSLSDGLFDPAPSPAFNSSPITLPNKGRKNQDRKDAFDALFDASPIVHKGSRGRAVKKNDKDKKKKGTHSKIGVRMDENQLQILDELPSSAVEMQVKDKFLKKLNRQERVVEEVKVVLKPHYTKKHITKEEYKDIMRKAVPKICHNKTGEINPKKISALIEAYVKKVRSSKKKSYGGTSAAAVISMNNKKPAKTLWS